MNHLYTAALLFAAIAPLFSASAQEAEEPLFTASPAHTMVVKESGLTWSFTFKESLNVPTDFAEKVSVTLNETTLKEFGNRSAIGGYADFSDDKIFRLTFSDNNLVPGTLTVNFQEGAFFIGDALNPAFSYSWNLVEDKEYTFTMDPADGSTVGDLGSVIITFPEAAEAVCSSQSSIKLRNMDFPNGERYTRNATTVELLTTDEEGVSFKITFDPAPTVAQDYYVSMSSGAFTIDEAFKSPVVRANYTLNPLLSGVENVADSETPVTVVSADGRVLLRNASPASVNTLDPGLYIVNGKKILKK